MNALLIQRRRQSLRIVEAALAATPADIVKAASLVDYAASNPRKEDHIITMPIKNAPKKPKASSKTDAMKALNAESTDTPEIEESASAVAPAVPANPRPFAGVLRNVAPKPNTPVMPASLHSRAANVVAAADDEASDAEDEDAPTDAKKPLIAFDAQVWQWVGDSGAFVHIKTGEARQEDDFLKPGGKGRNEEGGDHADWDAPQDSANDW